MATLHELREEEEIDEGDEDSPLRQDFGDFASFEPARIKASLKPRYILEPYGENLKATRSILKKKQPTSITMTTPSTTPTSSASAAAAASAAAMSAAAAAANFLEMNPSKVPLKAVFDDFDGISTGSLASSKDTLNLPFAEDSLKSVRSSPYIRGTSTSRGNISQTSLARSNSPHSYLKHHQFHQHQLQQQQQQMQHFQRTFTDSLRSVKSRTFNHDYENTSQEILASLERKRVIPSKRELPSIETVDVSVEVEKKERLSTPSPEYVNDPDTLNNGFASGNSKSTSNV